MTVVIDLREKSLERYLYLLARLFFEAGYAVHFRAHPEVIGQALKYAGKYGKLILAIPGITLGTGREVDASRAVYLTDVATSTAPDRPWRAVVRVDYDWYGAPDGGLVVPYPMHPLQYEEGWQQSELTEFRRSERTVGVLFSGNADPEYYTSGPVVDTFGLLSRIAILDKLHAGVSDLALLDPPCGAGASQVKAGYDYFIKASSRVEGDTARKMVRTNGWRIKDGDQLRVLAHSSFFIAAPGVTIPHSHNIVEALAVGAVPITNYGHLMRPALTEEEALSFSTEDELLECVKEALEMSDERRQRMSQAAASYYDSHLSPSSFGRKFEAAIKASGSEEVRLHLNAEHPTAAALSSRR